MKIEDLEDAEYDRWESTKEIIRANVPEGLVMRDLLDVSDSAFFFVVGPDGKLTNAGRFVNFERGDDLEMIQARMREAAELIEAGDYIPDFDAYCDNNPNRQWQIDNLPADGQFHWFFPPCGHVTRFVAYGYGPEVYLGSPRPWLPDISPLFGQPKPNPPSVPRQLTGIYDLPTQAPWIIR